jgi:prepilin-type N-terminal cleavage/methylation domain-containing protein
MQSRSTSLRDKLRGFTLVEVMITIALMSVLLGLGLILSMDVYRGTLYRSTRQVLISSLTTARGRALSNMYQSTHGVCYAPPDFIIFRGTTYSATSPYNETVPGNPAVTLSSTGAFITCGSGTGIVFSQLAASTSNTGTITVSESGHADETVSVNSLGTIIW